MTGDIFTHSFKYLYLHARYIVSKKEICDYFTTMNLILLNSSYIKKNKNFSNHIKKKTTEAQVPMASCHKWMFGLSIWCYQHKHDSRNKFTSWINVIFHSL